MEQQITALDSDPACALVKRVMDEYPLAGRAEIVRRVRQAVTGDSAPSAASVFVDYVTINAWRALRTSPLPGRPYGIKNEARFILKKGTDDMPEIGGKRLGLNIKSALGGLRSDMATLNSEVEQAVKELRDVVAEAKAGVPQALRAEAAGVREAITELLGNSPPSVD